MSVSLNGVGAALGKSGAVVLAGCVENGYTRTHGASGYNRINPFQVENGNAPSEFVAPHTLGDWAGYSHATLNEGSGLDATSGYAKIVVTWTRPAGYTRDPNNLVQRVYWKDMGTSEDLSVNPFSSPTGTADGGDGTSYDATSGLTADHYYAVGVKVEWNDSSTTRESADSTAYDYAGGSTPLLGAGRGVSSGLIWSNAPAIDSVVQLTDPGTCYVGCTGCVDVKVNCTMYGTSYGTFQEKVGAGSWTTIDANLTPGTSSITRTSLDAGVQYQYRIRYNDVSPDTWSNTGSITTDCILP